MNPTMRLFSQPSLSRQLKVRGVVHLKANAVHPFNANNMQKEKPNQIFFKTV